MNDVAFEIVDLVLADERRVEQTAALLVDAFPHAWPDMAEALSEVQESFEPGRISRVAVDPAGDVLGWVGGIPHYKGNAWELHPLVVRADRRRMGLGRALVLDLETLVRERGAWTLYLGSDDEFRQTSISDVDLYPNIWEHIAQIRNLRGHPFGFYQRLGFVVSGIIPDANGWGRPDIHMAKRVRQSPDS
jgi:aminoglycoside 6'-N-acetyltransferase I